MRSMKIAELGADRGHGGARAAGDPGGSSPNVMYDVPSREDVAKVVISGEVVRDKVHPTIVPRDVAAAPREKSA